SSKPTALWSPSLRRMIFKRLKSRSRMIRTSRPLRATCAHVSRTPRLRPRPCCPMAPITCGVRARLVVASRTSPAPTPSCPISPKMRKAQAFLDTWGAGGEGGFFALRPPRPEGSHRTGGRRRLDESEMIAPALEWVLPAAAELADPPASLLAPALLPDLWKG